MPTEQELLNVIGDLQDALRRCKEVADRYTTEIPMHVRREVARVADHAIERSERITGIKSDA
jgi:hypothetical protein